MNSLVMGLQHELGISPLVATFGPTTISKLQALGDIGFDWNKNANIVPILQHGLCCKGYWGANGYGEYTAVTRDAVKKLRANMGQPEGGTGTQGGVTTAKIASAILNMDAYVRVAGGTDDVRRFSTGSTALLDEGADSIGPCDGHLLAVMCRRL
ncbi:Rv2525c-like glycoside hydrolase-like domain-containing protein OS=Streptomyces fumanus OX=67302 GN=GCM10018772_38640 PE=4 SV=1 [Streptomyces fumanus]